MKELIKAQLDFQKVDVIEVFEDVYIIKSEKKIGFSANTTLAINGIDYKVVAVSFADDQIYVRIIK